MNWNSIMDRGDSIEQLAQVLLRKTNEILVQRNEFLEVSGNGYNLFSSLSLTHEKFHTRMIASVLAPDARHGLGTLFLRRFLETLKQDTMATLMPSDPKRISVEIEKDIGPLSSNNETGGIIDIVIVTEGWIVAIENKVDEREENNQPKQLYRYKKWLSKQQPKQKLLVYLTPTGKSAPESSTYGNDIKLRAEKKDYQCISYDSIGKWIELCIQDSALFPRIRETLVQYRDYLGIQFSIPAFGDKYMNELVDLISKGNFTAAQAIKDNLDTAIQNLHLSIIKQAISKFDDKNLLASTDENPCVLDSFSTHHGLTIQESICWYEGCLVSGISLCGNEDEIKKIGQDLFNQYKEEPNNTASAYKDIFYWPLWFEINNNKDGGWRNACFLDGLSNPENQKQLVQEISLKTSRCKKIFNDIKQCFTSSTSGSCMVGCLVAIAVLALAISFFAYRGCVSTGVLGDSSGAPSAEPAKREWTAKEQVKNPVKYLKDQLAVLDRHYEDNAASLHQLQVTRGELERERANEDAELRQIDGFLDRAKKAYREAEAANLWPAPVAGFTLTREKAREKILEAAQRRKDIQERLTMRGNRMAAINKRIPELEAEQANIANLRKKIPQVIRDIETQKIIEGNGGVAREIDSIRISMEVLSPRFDNPNLDQMLSPGDSSSADSDFDAIMAEP